MVLSKQSTSETDRRPDDKANQHKSDRNVRLHGHLRDCKSTTRRFIYSTLGSSHLIIAMVLPRPVELAYRFSKIRQHQEANYTRQILRMVGLTLLLWKIHFAETAYALKSKKRALPIDSL